MRIVPLGCGSAFTILDWQSNFLIEENGKKMLIDAGSDIRFSLKDVGLSYKDIDALYITHLHADHIGGGEYLGFCSFFDPSKGKIKLFGQSDVINLAWQAWSPGMSSVQGRIMGLHDYFDVTSVENNWSFLWERIHFDIVQSVHIMNGFSIVPTYGLMVHQALSPKKLYITSDAQFNPNQIRDFYKMADVIIQDCETAYKSGVHAHYDELKTLEPEIKSKMWLTHRQDNVLAKWDDWKKKASDDGFLGFMQKGVAIEW